MSQEMRAVDSIERRRYFRIEDEIVLVYRLVAPEEVPDPSAFPEQMADQFSITSTLEYLTQESQAQLRSIQRDHPEVAAFLQTLERKIDVLAQALLISNNQLMDQPTRKVNLSAAGLAFDSEQTMSEGSVLELKMVVPPALVGIITFGRVVYCHENEGGGDYRIGVDFLSMREQDREFLIRHVVKRQLSKLRQQKQTQFDTIEKSDLPRP